MKLKYLILILILCSFTFLLSGCNDSNAVDQFSYVIAIGLDKGNSNKLNLSLQFPIANGSNGSGSSSQSSDSVTYSVECISIEDGINQMNNYISKPINLSHCRVIVFSEELANDGLSTYAYTLTNSIQIRPNANIIISKCPASQYLKNATSPLEEVAARYYEIILSSSEYTGYTYDMTLSDFFYSLNDTTTQPVAILGSINSSSAQNTSSSSSSETNSYKAGETPINSGNSVENSGLAVFKEDKLIGELDNIETMCYLMVTNRLDKCIITIPNPFKEGETIDLQLTLNNNTKTKVSTLNSNPYIEVNLNMKAQILSMTENAAYLQEENTPILENAVNSYLEKLISSYLYKTSKEYQSDISGFAKEAIKNFLTWDKWITYNWNENYRNAFFKVSVNTNIRSGKLFVNA